MTSAEVKGYLKQLKKRKTLSDNERKAVEFALEAVDLMLTISPIISKANKELKSVGNSNGDPVRVTVTAGEQSSLPNWLRERFLSQRKGDE